MAGRFLMPLLALAGATLLCVTAPARAEEGATLELATGAPNGVYHPVGAALCRLYNSVRPGDAPACVERESAGSVANIEALRNGRAEIALVQSDIAAAALRGGDPFAGKPYRELRVLLALHAEAFTIVTRRDGGIKSFEGLRGRRVNVGRRGSGQRATLGEVLQHMGWLEQRDFAGALELPPAEQGPALCAGEIDAVVHVVGHPSPAIRDTADLCDIRFVTVGGPKIERMLSRYPAFRATSVPGGLYRGVPEPTATIGVRALLIAPARLDDGQAARLVNAVLDGLDRFRQVHPALAALEAEDLRPPVGSETIHPGARRAFAEWRR